MIERPRWRLRLSRWIYPWWTEDEIDAAKWRAHMMRQQLGLVPCPICPTGVEHPYCLPGLPNSDPHQQVDRD